MHILFAELVGTWHTLCRGCKRWLEQAESDVASEMSKNHGECYVPKHREPGSFYVFWIPSLMIACID